MKPSDLREMLRANPQIDLKKVEQYEAYRAEMSEAGVDLSPAYRIAPPIGDQRARLPEQTRGGEQQLVSWTKR